LFFDLKDYSARQIIFLEKLLFRALGNVGLSGKSTNFTSVADTTIEVIGV